MPLDPLTITLIALTGLIAGTLGGMLGVGGSVIMIPALVFLLGQDTRPGFNQHLYQAAAMIVNVAVVLPAAWRHHRAGVIQPRILLWITPFALGFIFVGVWLSNRTIFLDHPAWLGRVLAVFLIYVIVVNAWKVVGGGGGERRSDDVTKRRRQPEQSDPSTTGSLDHSFTSPPPTPQYLGPSAPQPLPSALIGTVMGLVAGLMGVGGGAIAVPLQQVLLRLPLRVCIGNSAAIIAVTAGFGAFYKNITLPDAGLAPAQSLMLAALLAPTALVGGYLGAHLTHCLPLRTVRTIFVAMLLVAAWKLAALPIP